MYKKYKPRRGKTAAVAAAVPKIWWFLMRAWFLARNLLYVASKAANSVELLILWSW